jgi:hypothetical protein
MNRYVAAAFVVVLAATASAQPGPRRDGNWEVTVQMEMAGMPQAMPPMTLKQCITPEQAKDPSQLVPQQPGRGANPNDCKIVNQKITDTVVTWSMACTGQTPMTMDGELVYAGDSYSGVMKMNTEMNGKPTTMTMKMKGKRLGDCTK